MGTLPEPEQPTKANHRLPGGSRKLSPNRVEELRKVEKDVKVIWGARTAVKKLLDIQNTFEDEMLYYFRRDGLLMEMLGDD